MYNYLAGFKLQTFKKLCVEDQHVNNGYIKVARVQNPNFYFIVSDSSLYNYLHFLQISNIKKDIKHALFLFSPTNITEKWKKYFYT